MRDIRSSQSLLPASISILGVLVLAVIAFPIYGTVIGVETFFNGLTLAAILLLLAVGMSLIYGLMNVLNLSHAAIFMFGAYIGTMVSIRPEYLLALAAYPLAFGAGIALRSTAAVDSLATRFTSQRIGTGLSLIGGTVAVATWVSNTPTALPGARVEALSLTPAVGIAILFVAGSTIALGLRIRTPYSTGPSTWTAMLVVAALLAAALTAWKGAEPLGSLILGLNSNVRFVLALAVAAVVGGAIGGVMESTLLRPLYRLHMTQITITFFVLIVIVELAKLFWGRNPLVMPRPDYLSGSGPDCPADGIVQALRGGCSSVAILGTQMATYRLFMVATAAVLLIAVGVALQKSKTGLYVRAGVEDADMVTALGIDVRRIFNRMFIVGSALAGFGGALAAPFLGVNVELALTLLVSTIFVVILGGLGSYYGAVLAALLLGYMTALSNTVVLRVGLTPEFTTATTMLLLVVVLLVRPQGIFGSR